MEVNFLVLTWLSLWGLLSAANEIIEPDVRVVGGSPAGSNEFPYFILLDGCAATLVHEDIALTAAHVSAILSFFLEESVDEQLPNLCLVIIVVRLAHICLSSVVSYYNPMFEPTINIPAPI